MTDTLKDVRPYVKYYRYDPDPILGLGGVHGTVWMGEVAPGRIYPVDNRQTVEILEGHDHWTSVTKADFDAQTKSDRQADEADDKEQTK